MLTPEQIDQYHRQGYLILERLLPPDRLEHYLSIFDELVHRARSLTQEEPHWTLELDSEGRPIPGFLHKIQGVCVVEPRILDLAKEPVILDRVQALTGPEIDLFGTKFFPKLPGGSTSTHWHQDNFYFGTTSDRIVTCGIYLHDSDRDNGCLRVIPGSHRSGSIVEHKRDTTTHGSWTEVDESQAIDVIVPGGTVVLFSANLLHGAYDNHSPTRARYSTAWHYIPSDLHLERFPRGEYRDRHVVRTRETVPR